MKNDYKMYRIRGAITWDQPMSAAEAAEDHRDGDQYEYGGKIYRLHQQQVAHGPRAHFEFMPGWN